MRFKVLRRVDGVERHCAGSIKARALVSMESRGCVPDMVIGRYFERLVGSIELREELKRLGWRNDVA
jgi:hypothetical protein